MEEQIIKKIVITGGPCAGKTTAMSWVQNAFTRMGYKVLFIPETATELISGGVAPWTCGTNEQYQEVQVALQLRKEQLFIQAAKTMPERKILIVCDRGIFDNKAYCTDEEFDRVLAVNGIDGNDAMNSYGAVFHLVTAANGAEKYYSSENNAARYETIEEAVVLDDRLYHCWEAHPHIVRVDNRTGFTMKMKFLIREIAMFLGEGEPYSIKRKFLADFVDPKIIAAIPGVKKTEILQTYLHSDSPDDEIRLRMLKTDGNYQYVQIVKHRIEEDAFIERERVINAREYLTLLRYEDLNMYSLYKARFTFNYEGQYTEVDYVADWSDKIMVKVKVNDHHGELVFPEMIKIIKEVTDDPKYKNRNISQEVDY